MPKKLLNLLEYKEEYATNDEKILPSIGTAFSGLFHKIGEKISFRKAHKELGILVDESEEIVKASTYRWHYMCILDTVYNINKNMNYAKDKKEVIINGLERAESTLKSLGDPAEIGQKAKMTKSAITNLVEGFRIWVAVKEEIIQYLNTVPDFEAETLPIIGSKPALKKLDINYNTKLFPFSIEKGALSVIKSEAEAIFSDLEDKEEGKKKTTKMRNLFIKSVQITFEEARTYYDISFYPIAYNMIKKNSPIDDAKKFLASIETSEREHYSSNNIEDKEEDHHNKSGHGVSPDEKNLNTFLLGGKMQMLYSGRLPIGKDSDNKVRKAKYYIFDLEEIGEKFPDVADLINIETKKSSVGILLIDLVEKNNKKFGCLLFPDNMIVYRTKGTWKEMEVNSYKDITYGVSNLFDIDIKDSYGSKMLTHGQADEIKKEYKKTFKPLYSNIFDKLEESLSMDSAIDLIEEAIDELEVDPTIADGIRKEINITDLELLIKQLEKKVEELSIVKPGKDNTVKLAKTKEQLGKAKTDLTQLQNSTPTE